MCGKMDTFDSDKHVKNYVDFYSSLGWNSLVCHSQFLNLFFPEKAAILALGIINQLVQELKLRPCPVVFASFSGGPKACMYKVLQIIEGRCEGQGFLDEYQLVRDCVSGYVFDSTPVDFVSDIGTRFAVHPSVLGMPRPPPLVSWIAQGISCCLDRFFLSHFELQRAEYWQTLYSTTAPYLIFCSEDDDLAPFQVIYNFASRLRQVGADVTFVQWKSSPHVGHFRRYPEDYKAAATKLLHKASTVYSQRIQQLKVEKSGIEAIPNRNSDHSCNMRKAAASSCSSLNGMAIDSTDDSLITWSPGCYGSHGDGSIQDEEHHISFSGPPETAITTGVLGQLLFGYSAPRNVEDWDTRLGEMINRSGHLHFNPMKCIRRSRL